MTIDDFMRARAAESYPEPITVAHQEITATMIVPVAKHATTGSKVLDVGCGQGPALGLFQELGFEAIGITVNAEDCGICIAKGYRCYICDQNDLGRFYDGYFDLVWARHVIEHSFAPFWTLHEFARVLKPAGVLYVEVPAPDTKSCHETNRNHYSVMGWRMWTSLIDRSGFELLDANQVGANPLPDGADHYFGFTCRKK